MQFMREIKQSESQEINAEETLKSYAEDSISICFFFLMLKVKLRTKKTKSIVFEILLSDQLS